VIEVNRAVATAFAEGPAAGVRILEPFLIDPDLERYQPLHAAHAELRRQMGDFEAAAEAYRRAIQLTTNNVEARELRQRLADLRGETA
jgi:RNA polymerase sigma-70 factor (ECF subfamily)